MIESLEKRFSGYGDSPEVQTEDAKGMHQNGRALQSREVVQPNLGRIVRQSLPYTEDDFQQLDPILVLVIKLPTEDWSDEADVRRCDLIDKDIEGTITSSEKRELAVLQERFHGYLARTSPIPMDGARELHRQLLEKKRAQTP